MPRRTGIILACDISDPELAEEAIVPLMPYIDFVKVGLEAMTAEDFEGFSTATFVRQLTIEDFGKNVMWDMKLHDIGNTVGAAAKNIVDLGSKMFTLHASASDAALKAAADAAGKQSLALAVTVLTDLDDAQCQLRFLPRNADPVDEFAKRLVVNFAKIAYGCGIRGFVCSAQEAQLIRSVTPPVTIVTPAIRPLWAVKPDEQKRVTTPAQASAAGADFVVIGRPILKPPNGMTSVEAVQRIREELDNAPVAA